MTSKQRLSTMVVCAALACQANGQDASLFPSLNDYSAETIRLHGLASLFPGRVLFEDPELNTTTESRFATRVEDLPHGIKYIRLYRLNEAETVLNEYKNHPALIIDFRFLKSTSAAVNTLSPFAPANCLDTLTTFGSTPDNLIETDVATTAQRDTPVITLCNRETAGPFEAVLHRLQQTGAIIAIGEPTAGNTGFYKKSAHETWMLNGELRPDNDTSLVAIGFVPRIQLEISTEENYLSYHLYEAGTSITKLLRQSLPSEAEYHQTTSEDKVWQEPDRILQRGVDIIDALHILQQQPEI